MDEIFYPTGNGSNLLTMIIVCILSHAEYGRNDHWEDAELKVNNIFSHLMELGFRVEAIGKKVSLDNQDYLSTTGCSILSPTERVLP